MWSRSRSVVDINVSVAGEMSVTNITFSVSNITFSIAKAEANITFADITCLVGLAKISFQWSRAFWHWPFRQYHIFIG